ncbi:hypothetical protein ACIREE_39475 [Streptomyces sp. NPDC102467]|uniref:hypothetical protein n=1 Tax=Streptomyces sp. NPDC102467 TaxID=3366179 RepID=UPI003828B034
MSSSPTQPPGAPDGSPVQYVGTEQQPRAIYHIYRGPDREQALAFLRSTPVAEPLIYLVVETPQGNVGRDLVCLFDERSGAVIEFGPRTPSQHPRQSPTHCAWCGVYVVPFDVPEYAVRNASTLSVYLAIDEARDRGHGWHCRACALLQCVFCCDPTDMRCRGCGSQLTEVVKEITQT